MPKVDERQIDLCRMARVRMDKWLRVARFFKTRALAARAGRITSRELRLKLAEERKAMPYFDRLQEGKPSKRNWRELDRLSGQG